MKSRLYKKPMQLLREKVSVLPQYSVFVVSIANPILVGIYQNNQLIQQIEKEGKTSDILPEIMEDILKKFTLTEIIYVNGPGSYMAIKIAYIFLKTISITNNILLKAIDGFQLNQNSPIKALGKKYFFKDDNDKIKIDFLHKDTVLNKFELPKNFVDTKMIFSEDTLPNYNLPAV